MSVLITTQGVAHIAALEAAGALTNDFRRLVLGTANNAVGATDTLATIGTELVSALVDDGYPVKGDSDVANAGRGATIYTWRWTFEPGADPFVGSNLVVVDELAGPTGLALVSADEVVSRARGERITVFLNLPTSGTAGDLRVVAEEPALEASRSLFVPRAFALAAFGADGGVTGDRVVARPGEPIRVMALMRSFEGGILDASEVSGVQVDVARKDRFGQVRPFSSAAGKVHTSIITGDTRYPHPDGYNVSADWIVPAADRNAQEYEVTMTVRTPTYQMVETWTLEVRSTRGASGR